MQWHLKNFKRSRSTQYEEETSINHPFKQNDPRKKWKNLVNKLNIQTSD